MIEVQVGEHDHVDVGSVDSEPGEVVEQHVAGLINAVAVP